MTSPRLYLDEDMDPLLARILTARGYDVLTTQEARRVSSSDANQLVFAAQEHRALLTHNIARDWAAEGKEHSGIVVSDQLALKELLARILRLLHHHTPDTLHNRVIRLQDFRR
jgi:uncharacterized protein with PIN domain